MTLACLHLGLTPSEALAAFTRNSAQCLGIAAEYGSIAPGMRAAFTVWDVSEFREIPYWAGGNLVLDTLIV
jgi:imidazolonepropionase